MFALYITPKNIRGVRDLNTGLELPKLKAYQASLTPLKGLYDSGINIKWWQPCPAEISAFR